MYHYNTLVYAFVQGVRRRKRIILAKERYINIKVQIKILTERLRRNKRGQKGKGETEKRSYPIYTFINYNNNDILIRSILVNFYEYYMCTFIFSRLLSVIIGNMKTIQTKGTENTHINLRPIKDLRTLTKVLTTKLDTISSHNYLTSRGGGT